MARQQTIHEFKFEPSADGQWFLIHLRDERGKVTTHKLPIGNAAKWVGLQLDALGRAGLKRAPRSDATVPEDQIHVCLPLEVSLSQQRSEPTLVMDYRVGALGFAVDRESLTHVLGHLLTRYPVGPQGKGH